MYAQGRNTALTLRVLTVGEWRLPEMTKVNIDFFVYR